MNEASIKEYLEHHGDDVDDGIWVKEQERT
jgi:hypothetical protein